jgi:oligopeptide/dipeptide ABC transporter ATP-binding protein
MAGGNLIDVRDLRVQFTTDDGPLTAVDGVSFSVRQGQTLGIVGESGSGKSVSTMTILGLTQGENTEISGSIEFEGRELQGLEPDELRRVRGEDIAMIFQDPLTSLHPFYRVGDQIVEALRAHHDVGSDEASNRAVELLELVGIPDATRRLRDYPHEFSGGMRQRAMIAMALVNDPKLLIADEPTTALDVTIQAQILKLLERLQEELGMAIILITHDLGTIAEIADDVIVMYAGEIVESGTLEQIFYDPQHPYTWGLLGSVMRLDRPRSARLAQIKGQPPSLLAPPEGCRFRPRCPHAFDKCATHPALMPRSGEGSQLDRCWLSPDEKRAKRTMESGDIGLEAA